MLKSCPYRVGSRSERGGKGSAGGAELRLSLYEYEAANGRYRRAAKTIEINITQDKFE